MYYASVNTIVTIYLLIFLHQSFLFDIYIYSIDAIQIVLK